MLITRKSPLTGITHTMDLPITEEQLKQWRDGALIQHCMGHLNADQREFILTGITPEEWDAEFEEDEEDT